MKNTFAIKLANNIVIGYEDAQKNYIAKDKNNISEFDYSVKLGDQEINVNIIMKNIIDRKFGEIGSNHINLSCIDEIIKLNF